MIAEAPAWLLERLAAADQPTREAPDGVDGAWALEYARREIEQEWLPKGRAPHEGSRNTTTFHRACRLYELGVEQEHALGLLTWFLSYGEMPDESVEGIVDRAYNKPRPERNPFGSALPPPEKPMSVWFSLDELEREPWDIADRIKNGCPTIRVARTHAHPTADPPQFEDERTWADLMATPKLGMWLDYPVAIPRYRDGGTGSIWGRSGTQKTGFVLLLATRLIAAGARVCYLYGEGDEDIGARVRALTEHYALPTYGADVFKAGPVPPLFDDGALRRLAHWLEPFNPDVTFIDTLSTGLSGMPDDERVAHMMTSTGRLGQLAREFQQLVLVVDHTGHEGKHERGHSGKRDNTAVSIELAANVDVAEMERAPTHIRAWQKKLKGGKPGSKRYFAIEEVGLECTAILVECMRPEWELATDKKFELDYRTVADALAKLKAFDQDRGVSAIQIARTLVEQRSMDAEAHGEHCRRIAAQLSTKGRKELAALCHLDDNGAQQWWTELAP